MVVQELRELVRSGGLLVGDGGGGHPILAMLSGGRDSVCLLDVAVALRGAGNVSALHVNYGLREAADAEQRHCLELCLQLGVELEVVRAERPSGGAAAGDEDAGRSPIGPGNAQAWAREVRYREADRLARTRDARIATGHTASDQVETILYRLAASPGRRALLGMPANEGRLIRPLLTLSREQTAAYCRERGLRWCEDQSNQDERYARTRVRHGLLPALRAVHPAAEANVLRTASLLREETALLDALVTDELRGRSTIALTRLSELPAALARLIVVRLAEDAAGAYVPQAGDRVAEILALARRRGRAELHVGGQAAAIIEDGLLRMVRLPPRQ
jgi:tRNA(Ile)-lysidine synthase